MYPHYRVAGFDPLTNSLELRFNGKQWFAIRSGVTMGNGPKSINPIGKWSYEQYGSGLSGVSMCVKDVRFSLPPNNEGESSGISKGDQ